MYLEQAKVGHAGLSVMSIQRFRHKAVKCPNQQQEDDNMLDRRPYGVDSVKEQYVRGMGVHGFDTSQE